MADAIVSLHHTKRCVGTLTEGAASISSQPQTPNRLMRNLFKITRSALAVNARGYSWLVQQIGNTAIYLYASIPAKCLHPALS
jgi:hypothetical protein